MTLVEQLADNRVRLTVDVSAHELEHAGEHADQRSRGEREDPRVSQREGADRGARLPHRQGPHLDGGDRVAHRRLVLERRGTQPRAARLPPDYSFDALPDGGESWTFTAEVDVQPMPEIVDWKELEVPRAEVEVPEELVEEELEAIRRSVAGVLPVDRPAEQGDTLVIDLRQPDRRGAVRHDRRARARGA